MQFTPVNPAKTQRDFFRLFFPELISGRQFHHPSKSRESLCEETHQNFTSHKKWITDISVWLWTPHQCKRNRILCCHRVLNNYGTCLKSTMQLELPANHLTETAVLWTWTYQIWASLPDSLMTPHLLKSSMTSCAETFINVCVRNPRDGLYLDSTKSYPLSP